MITNFTGVSGSRIAYLAAAELKNKGKALIVVSTSTAAKNFAEDLAFFMPERRIIVLPEAENPEISYEVRDRSQVSIRIKAMQALACGENEEIVIAPISAVLKPTLSVEKFRASINTIEVGMRIEPTELKQVLVDSGYKAVPASESEGEFSSRAGIVDVFTPAYQHPLRIEFFDDEIESIRFYNQDDQRSISNVEKIEIGPATETVSNDDKHFLWEYAKEKEIVVCDPNRVIESIPEFQNEKDFYGIYDAECRVITPFPEPIKGVEKVDKIVNIKSRQIASFNGQLELFVREISGLIKNGHSIEIVCSSDERIEGIRTHLLDSEVHGDIIYSVGNLSAGMVFDDDKKCIVTESDIFPQIRKKTPKHKNKKSKDSLQFSDLHTGDYVVHETHGIGRFEGIKTMTADGNTRDYLVIRYAGSDVLYIPTEQLDIIQKYIGSNGHAPSLSRLSGVSWNRTKERAKKAIMEIAEDLVKLYAEREAAGGYAFSKDTIWQTEFEEAFPYTETDDQLRATEEIKEDMQRALPMDRLLCGDVGYGKTEVAARAIFKCLSEGKQAAILAPTTLLVNQHYHNFVERFEGFPFEIAELSRFKSAAKQAEAVRGLKDGSVDLVIGTHRLLSQDVQFKDLGLLVIDEEQRFGVQHKEQIKKLRNNIDVLTLSATPIPRTLNMSLTGVKDISTIEEPPGDRYPVQTFVTPYEEEMVKNIIEKELNRGGQAYVVNNRVTGIKTIAEKIQELVPEAKVAIGHGRMSETTLENTMMDFISGDTNVLVATTIIENGIDIPNANTMIILNADKLGLAQLYQLRGRVGRSNRLAYAYLMYQPQKVLTEIATKRLTSIREFTEFGAGFKLAMRDLELRGAGNMLGEAQSGHIEGIGYELYCKEIERAVRLLKGEVQTDSRIELSFDMNVKAVIPSTYINDETLKLQAYKKIANINCKADALDIIDELADRYGDLPRETENLIMVSEIRAICEKLGIDRISEQGSKIFIKFAENNIINAYMLIMTQGEFEDSLTILDGMQYDLSISTGGKQSLKKLLDVLRILLETANTSQEAEK